MPVGNAVGKIITVLYLYISIYQEICKLFGREEGIIRHFPVPDPAGSPLKGAAHD